MTDTKAQIAGPTRIELGVGAGLRALGPSEFGDEKISLVLTEQPELVDAAERDGEQRDGGEAERVEQRAGQFVGDAAERVQHEHEALRHAAHVQHPSGPTPAALRTSSVCCKSFQR